MSRRKKRPPFQGGAGQIWVTRLDSRLLAYINRASRKFIAMRACTKVCLPASKDARTNSQCLYGQVPIITASMSSRCNRVWGSVMASADRPCSAMTFSPLSILRLHIATTSASSIFASPGKCRLRKIPPAPIMPMRILSAIFYLAVLSLFSQCSGVQKL